MFVIKAGTNTNYTLIKMYTKISGKYNNLNWDYLEISDMIINTRYDWVFISFPATDRKFPWAHEYDIIRLFIITTTFRSDVEALSWIKCNLTTKMLPVHFELIDSFCYSEIEVSESIDELIVKADNFDLLDFIHRVLDRSLLWYNPESSWPGDFKIILWDTSTNLKQDTNIRLKWVDRPEVEGVHFVSAEVYTHVFYKFQNLMKGIEKGEIYYNIKDLAKQAHEVLVKSMLLFFSKKVSSLDDINWERKMTEITKKEIDWCKTQLQKITKTKFNDSSNCAK